MLGLELRESEYGRDAFGGMGTSNQQRPPIPRPPSGVQQKMLGGAPVLLGLMKNTSGEWVDIRESQTPLYLSLLKL